jgi:hypothetical protein
MFTLRKSDTHPVTRELASEFVSMAPSPTERPFDETRLKFLQERYDLGFWLPCQWASVWLGGSQFRMNGNHSSTLLVKLPDPFPNHLKAHIDEYEADAPEDMVELFRQFDARKSSRSAGDVAGAYQHRHPELLDIPTPIAKVGIESIAWYLRVIEGVPTGKGDDRYKLFRQPTYYDFLHWLGHLLDIKTPELRKKETIAAMYATDLVASGTDESHAFWEEVARGGRPYEDQHPTTVLDKWLKSCSDGTCEDKMRAAFHYQGCIYAWNAFREERTIKDIRFATSKGLYVPHP